ncbi:MAG: hypothetical protein FWE14_08500 [Lachnospiraceae bacterium]|nr:hypothetical protein [Lachnospiraceae bacterium]
MSTFNFNNEVKIKNKGNVNFGDVYINTTKCLEKIEKFQDELTDFANELKQAGYISEAKEIEDICDTFEEVETIMGNASQDVDLEEVMDKGRLTKIKQFIKDMTDENSDLYQKTVKLRERTKKVLNIYNEIAKLIPALPQVPDVFLGKKECC